MCAFGNGLSVCRRSSTNRCLVFAALRPAGYTTTTKKQNKKTNTPKQSRGRPDQTTPHRRTAGHEPPHNSRFTHRVAGRDGGDAQQRPWLQSSAASPFSLHSARQRSGTRRAGPDRHSAPPWILRWQPHGEGGVHLHAALAAPLCQRHDRTGCFALDEWQRTGQQTQRMERLWFPHGRFKERHRRSVGQSVPLPSGMTK